MKIVFAIVVAVLFAAVGGYAVVEAQKPKGGPITDIGIISKPVDGAFVK